MDSGIAAALEIEKRLAATESSVAVLSERSRQQEAVLARIEARQIEDAEGQTRILGGVIVAAVSSIAGLAAFIVTHVWK